MSCCNPPKKDENNQHTHTSQGCCSKPKQEEVQPAHSGGCCSKPKQEDSAPKSGGCCSQPKQEQSSCCSSEKKQKPTSINREMTIEDILGMFPNKAQKLSQEITNAGLHCIGCHAAVWETLEAGMMKHGKTNEQIDELTRRLNALLNEPVDAGTISITERGAAKFQEILTDEGKHGWGMRFSEELAGCNGYEFILDFSEKADEDDEIFNSSGVEIHVKKAMISRLLGSEIDYVEGLRGAGFKISNPNVRSACGCGSSHNY